MLPDTNLSWNELQTLAGMAVGVYVFVTALLALVPKLQDGPKLALAAAAGCGLGVLVAVLSPPVTAQGMVLAVLNGLAAGILAAGGQPAAAGVWRAVLGDDQDALVMTASGSYTSRMSPGLNAPRRVEALTTRW